MKYIAIRDDVHNHGKIHSCCNSAAVIQNEGNEQFFICECETFEIAEIIAKALNKIMELN